MSCDTLKILIRCLHKHVKKSINNSDTLELNRPRDNRNLKSKIYLTRNKE